MPVRTFGSVEAMDRTTERERAERGVDWQAIAHVLAIAGVVAPRHVEPGVYKHRTVESWTAQSARWQHAVVDRADAPRTLVSEAGPARWAESHEVAGAGARS